MGLPLDLLRCTTVNAGNVSIVRTQEAQTCAFSWLGFVGDFQFLHGNAVAPDAHEALLRCVAERVLAVFAVKSRVAQTVEQFPRAVEIERINHHRLDSIAPACSINLARRQTAR